MSEILDYVYAKIMEFSKEHGKIFAREIEYQIILKELKIKVIL